LAKQIDFEISHAFSQLSNLLDLDFDLRSGHRLVALIDLCIKFRWNRKNILWTDRHRMCLSVNKMSKCWYSYLDVGIQTDSETGFIRSKEELTNKLMKLIFKAFAIFFSW